MKELPEDGKIALIILKAVKELQEGTYGLIGKQTLVPFLQGSRSKRMMNLSTVPGWGALYWEHQDTIANYLDQLRHLLLLRTHRMSGPYWSYYILVLTPEGEKALQDRQKTAIDETNEGKTFIKQRIACISCDREVDENFVHCPHCGTSLLPEQQRVKSTNPVVVLGESESPTAIPQLIEYAKSDDYNKRRLAASALGKLARFRPQIYDAVPHLIKMLDDGKPQVRQYTLKALRKIGDTRALRRIKEIANHDDASYNQELAQEIMIKFLK